MAVIKIDSSPLSATMTATWTIRPGDSYNTVSSSSTIFQYDQSALGADPTVTDATLELSSTHGANDMITVQFGQERAITWQPSKGALPCKVYILKALSSGRLDVTLKYYGFSNETGVTKITSVVAAQLQVTIDGEAPIADRRSSATIDEESVDFGGTVHLTLTPVRESYTPEHRIRFTIGTKTSDWRTITETAATINVPSDAIWMGEMPNTSSGTMTIELDTLYDGQSVGTREYTIQVTVPASMVPTMNNVSVRVVNPDTLTDNNILTGVTRFEFTIGTLTGSTGADIASIRYAGWGDAITVSKPASTSGITQLSTVVQQSGTLKLLITATDTRGRTVKRELSATAPATQYTPPSFTSVVCVRCDADGTPLERGSTAKVRAAFKCDTTAVSGNTVSCEVKLRRAGASDWLLPEPVKPESGEEVVFATLTLDTMLSYEIVLVITDNVMSAQQVVRLPALQYMLHFSNNGRSIGVGQVAAELAETDNGRLTVNPDWTVAFGQNVMIGSQTLAEYIQSIVTAMQGS